MITNAKLKKFFLFFSPTLLLFAALVATACTGVNHRTGIDQTVTARDLQDEMNAEIDWSRNIAYIALDLEKELNKEYVFIDLDRGPITVQDLYATLDNLLDKAKKRIKVKKAYTEEEAINTSVMIHRILKEEGFKYKDLSSWEYYLLGSNLLGYGLARREIDCLGYVLLYLGISEHVGVPLVGINMPGHLALRWNFNDGRYFNWEATVPATCKNSFYISWKHISEVALRNGVYIKAEGLCKKEVIAHVYYNTGLVLKERRQLDRAMTALDKATTLFPKYADAYNLKGVIWRLRGETVKAIGQYDTAIGFDPNFSDAYYNRADAKWKIKDRIGTKKDLTVLKTLDLGLAERLEYMIQEI